MNLYRSWLRPLAFRFDPERAHDLAIAIAERASSLTYIHSALQQYTTVFDDRLQVRLGPLTFDNPVGLAAGYDKSGRAVDGLSAIGFGHIEVGSVSADPSDGNPKPRLFRLPEDEAVIVHYGLQNDGSVVVAGRLQDRTTTTPVGVNIVKTNRGIDAPPESADEIIDEYVRAVKAVHGCADYLTLNLSCPNTEDGRDFFAETHHIRDLLLALSGLAIDRSVFLKISPLGGEAFTDGVLEAVNGYGFISGFIFNLAPGVHSELKTPASEWRDLPGALSGRPVAQQMRDCVRALYQKMDADRYHIVAAGGISTAEDAYRMMKQGASAVQLLTALVYEGPWAVKRINEGLCRLMDRDGVGSLADVVGIGVS